VILGSGFGSGAVKACGRLSMWASRALGFWPSSKTVNPSPPVAIKLFAATAIVRGRLPNWVLPPSMPGRWLDRVIGRTLGLT
jgi:hypothetical protein